MRQTVYVDILICVNLFINYFILLATTRFLRISTKRIKLILAACIASVYSLYIFLPYINIFVSFIVKIFMSITIVLTAFYKIDKKTFFKALACFYSMSFAFCGIIFALWCSFSLNGVVIHNGIIYFNISPLVLIAATVVSYVVISIINRILARKYPKKIFCKIEIKLDDNIIQAYSKVDTGNSLKEPFSNLPTVVIEYKYIENILPVNIRPFFKEAGYNNLNESKLKSWKHQYRLIPFRVISGSGVLPAFKPDEFCLITEKGRVYKDVYIAICKSGILGKEFNALINPELLDL